MWRRITTALAAGKVKHVHNFPTNIQHGVGMLICQLNETGTHAIELLVPIHSYSSRVFHVPILWSACAPCHKIDNLLCTTIISTRLLDPFFPLDQHFDRRQWWGCASLNNHWWMLQGGTYSDQIRLMYSLSVLQMSMSASIMRLRRNCLSALPQEGKGNCLFADFLPMYLGDGLCFVATQQVETMTSCWK